MNSLLLESLPYIKIEDDIIDLDHEAEVVPVTTWDDKIRNMLTKSMDGKVPLEDLLKLYIRSLQDQMLVSKDKSLLKEKILTHLNYFHIYYMEMNDFLHLLNYYELIEDVLANYCTLELDLLRWKFPHRTKTKKKKHYQVEVKYAFHRIWTVVTTFLGQQEVHILHVLLKMRYRKFSEVSTETRRLLYSRALFDKPISDLSDEGLCRLWIIFQKFKETVPSDQIDQLERLFEATYGAIELKRSSEIIRNVFYVNKRNGSRIANLLHIKDRVVKNYFYYMKMKKQKEDQPFIDTSIPNLCDNYDEEVLCEMAFGRNLPINDMSTRIQLSSDEVVNLDDDDDDIEKSVVILSDNEEEVIPKKNNKKLNQKNESITVNDDIIDLESDDGEDVMFTSVPLQSTKSSAQLPTVNISESVVPALLSNPPELKVTDSGNEKRISENSVDLLTNSSKEKCDPVQLITNNKNEKIDVAPPLHPVDKLSADSENITVKVDIDSEKDVVNRDLSPVYEKDHFYTGLSVCSPKTINGKITRLGENCESEHTHQRGEIKLAPIQTDTDPVCSRNDVNSSNENTTALDMLKTMIESLLATINDTNGSPNPTKERILEIQSQFQKKVLSSNEAVSLLMNEMKDLLTKKPEHTTFPEDMTSCISLKSEIDECDISFDSELLVSVKSDPEDVNEDELLEESAEDNRKPEENNTVQNHPRYEDGSLETTHNEENIDNVETNNVNMQNDVDANIHENIQKDVENDANVDSNKSFNNQNAALTVQAEPNVVFEIPKIADINVESIPEKEFENITAIVEFIKAPLQFRNNPEERETAELMDVFSEIADIHHGNEQLDNISSNDEANGVMNMEKCDSVEKQDKTVVQPETCGYAMTPPSENYCSSEQQLESQKKIVGLVVENYSAKENSLETVLMTPNASEGKAESISEEHIYLGNLPKQTLNPQNVNESTDDYEDSLYGNDNYDSEVSTPDFKMQKDPIYKSFLNEHFDCDKEKGKSGVCNGPMSIAHPLVRPKHSDTESSKSGSFGNCDKVLASVTMNDYIAQKSSGKKPASKETIDSASRMDGFEAEFQDSLSGRITKINGTNHRYNNYSLFDCEKSDGNFVKPAWDAPKVGANAAAIGGSWPSVLKADSGRVDLESKQSYQMSSGSTSSSPISSPEEFEDVSNKKGEREFLEKLNSLRKVNTIPKGILTTKSQSFPTPVASLIFDSDGETPYDRTKRKLEDKEEDPPKKKRVVLIDNKNDDEVELWKRQLKSVDDKDLNNHFTKTRCIIDRVSLETQKDKKEAESTVASPSRVPDPEKYLKEHPFTGRNGFLRGKTSRRGRAKVNVGNPSLQGRGKRGRGRGRRRNGGSRAGRGGRGTMNTSTFQDLFDFNSHFNYNVQDT